jgi:hypothetical protein
MTALGKCDPVAGNIGIFCQTEEEYIKFLALKDPLTKPSTNPNQKYFELLKPIKIDAKDILPEAIYTHLYIRKPDYTPYGKYLGDVDFVMDEESYKQFKLDVLAGKYAEGIEIYNRPNWDTVQITYSGVSSVAYISTKEFSEKVRIKFD